MDWLFPLFLGTTIFGLSISIMDFIGGLNNDGEDGEIADGDSDGVEDGSDASGEDGDPIEAQSDAESSEEGAEQEGEEQGSRLAFQQKSITSPLIRILQGMRFLVYFSLGFGPIGLVGLGLGYSWLETLLVSSALGILTSGIALGVRKLMIKTTDSQVKHSGMIMEKGIITVRINPGEIGKVRVNLGGRYEERFAKLAKDQESLAPGTKIIVTDFDEEYLYVEAI